jgi:uncharacterized protein YidB (DUF937 family)
MGLFDSIVSSVLGGQAAGSPVTRSALDLLGGSGGLGGVVQAFEQKGLGSLVQSWVGSGQNLPVSAAQVQQALGPMVQKLAQQHGLSTEAVSQSLSQLLPGLVDHLTPNGQLPQAGALDQGLSALRSKLGL